MTTKNFFKPANFKNLVINMSPRFIIACGVSGCLITKPMGWLLVMIWHAP